MLLIIPDCIVVVVLVVILSQLLTLLSLSRPEYGGVPLIESNPIINVKRHRVRRSASKIAPLPNV